MKLPIRRVESRATYRVSVEEDQSSLWIGLPSGPLKVQLEDLSAHGCGFVVDALNASSLAIDEELVLRLRVGPKTSPQLFIRAEVRDLQPQGEAVRAGVAFKDRQRLYQQLNLPQWLYFNRRGAFRVPPVNHRGAPLRASFYNRSSTKEFRFTVHNLSSSGLAIRLPRNRELALSTTQILRTRFELPGIDAPFDLRLRYVHRTLFQGVECVGMKFDPDLTRDFEDQSERILGYVFERQSQLLRG